MAATRGYGITGFGDYIPRLRFPRDPIAATGLRMIYEVFTQLLRCAGERQLPSPAIGLTHNLGCVPALGIAAVSLLGLH